MAVNIENDLRLYVVRYSYINLYGDIVVESEVLEAFNRDMAISLTRDLLDGHYWTDSVRIISAKIA